MSSNQLSGFNYGVPPYANLPIKNITAAYLVQPSDNGWILNCTSGTFTVSLAPAATLATGFNVTIWNTSATSTDAITIDPAGSQTIDRRVTRILRRGEGMQIVCDGTNWQTGNKKTMRGYADNIGDTAPPVASGSASVAIGQDSVASGNASISIGDGTDATASNSVAIGQNSLGSASQAVTGSGAMALGGSYASGTDSFAAAVANNTSTYGAQGANSIAMGQTARATAADAIAIGEFAVASNSYAISLGNGTASGIGSFCVGWGNLLSNPSATASGSIAIGESCSASGLYSVAFGRAALAAIEGKYAYTSNQFAARGDSQTGTLVLRRLTTDGVAVVLTSDGSGAGNYNQVIIPNNSAYAFTGTVVARRQASGGTASAAWKIEGLIRREGAANTTTLVASTVTAIDNTPGWTLALSADTTNGGLKVEATGAASTNIRWVATVQTSEVTYA